MFQCHCQLSHGLSCYAIDDCTCRLALLDIITEARRYEIFAATAAYVLDPLLQSLSMLTMVFSYSAVLVVFLGNVQGYQQQK
jgi:hypothetical protein